jgi:NADH-quinone oxidoreductase subunit N
MNSIDQSVLGFAGVGYLGPIWVLLAGVVVLMLADMFARRGDGKSSGVALLPSLIISYLSVLGALAACLWTWFQLGSSDNYAVAQLFVSRGAELGSSEGAVAWFGAALIVDRFGLLSCLVISLVLGLAILTLAPYLKQHKLHRPEIFPLLLLSAVGMLLLVLSRDMLLTFAAIELLSLPLYVLCGLRSADEHGREASLKYFLLGAFASGFLIYGAALLYGAAGHLNYSAIAAAIESGSGVGGLLYAGLALTGVGLAFKLALVPFHTWVPDVYQGSPTPITGFMASAVKLAVAIAFMRVIVEAVHGLSTEHWQLAIVVFAALSMFGGNLLALHQMSIKRLLACSAIAHSGYLAVGLAAGSMEVTSSMLVYLIGYVVAASGAFALISYLAPEGQDDIFLDQMNSLFHRAPVSCIGLSVLLLSLGGFPLTLGFIGKLLLFRDAWQAGLSGLVIFALLNSVVSFYYYLRIVMAMFMQPVLPGTGDVKLHRMAGHYVAVSAVTVFATLLLGVFPGLILSVTDSSRIDRSLLTRQPAALDVEAASDDSRL